jgi:hypothetical protein
MLLSLEKHLQEESMSQVQVKALRGFVLEGKVIEPGETVTVSKGLARQLIHASQAEFAKAETPAATPVQRADPPALVTQTVPVETPEGGSGGRRTRT